MIYFQIGSVVLLGLVALISWALQYRFQDRRTRYHKWIRTSLLLLLVLSLLVNIPITMTSYNDQRGLQADAKGARESSQRSEALLDTMLCRYDSLTAQMDSLQHSIVEFSALASNVYPRLSPFKALDSLKQVFASVLESSTSGSEKRLSDLIIEPRFRELSVERTFVLIARLKALKEKWGAKLSRVVVQCAEGNRERELLAKQLAGLLYRGGIDTRLGSFFQLGKSSLASAQVTFRNGEEQIAKELVETIGIAVLAQFQPLGNPTDSSGSFTLRLLGEPLFASDGLTRIR